MKSGSHKRKDTYNHPKEGSENISSNYSSIPIQKNLQKYYFFFFIFTLLFPFIKYKNIHLHYIFPNHLKMRFLCFFLINNFNKSFTLLD